MKTHQYNVLHTWYKTITKPKGSIGRAFAVHTCTERLDQASFCPFTQREVSVLAELALGHLRYCLTDVPPQPNSQSDTVPESDQADFLFRFENELRTTRARVCVCETQQHVRAHTQHTHNTTHKICAMRARVCDAHACMCVYNTTQQQHASRRRHTVFQRILFLIISKKITKPK